MLNLNHEEIPFSKANSFLKIQAFSASESGRVQICTSSKLIFESHNSTFYGHDFYEVALFKQEKEVKYKAVEYPWQLDLISPEGNASFTFADAQTFVFEADGLEVRLIPCKAFCWKLVDRNGDVVLLDYSGNCHHQHRAGTGTTLSCYESLTSTGYSGEHADKPYTLSFLGKEKTTGAIRFNRFGDNWEEFELDVKTSAASVKKEIDEWMQKMPSVSEKYRETTELAWFIMWNCTAPAEGELTRSSILMSKNYMNSVWAWDNCFNALSVAKANPEMAWDQLLLFFDKQAENGMLPDSITSQLAKYGYVKPPIYGWTIMKLIEMLGVDYCLPYLENVFDNVERLTNWWFEYRDTDDDGMCQYLHGNDSGWDNSTMFDQGYPTEGSDLAAHLTLQMEALAYMAELLGRHDEGVYWKNRSRQQLETLLEQGVKDNRFFSPLDTLNTVQESHSLLNYIPIVLGNRLPKEILEALVSDLSPGGSFLTDYGLATEAITSSKYQEDGYWRGPIWAPSTYLIFDGLVGAGQLELAKVIAERFCDMCVKDPGMYENYNALTGKGLRCPTYSWTAAVYILLAEWLS